GVLPWWISVYAVAVHAWKEWSAKSFNAAVNDCEERDLNSTVAKHGAPSPNAVRSRPNSVNWFVGRLVITAVCRSKLAHPPVLTARLLLNPQISLDGLQPAPVSVSTRS